MYAAYMQQSPTLRELTASEALTLEAGTRIIHKSLGELQPRASGIIGSGQDNQDQGDCSGHAGGVCHAAKLGGRRYE